VDEQQRCGHPRNSTPPPRPPTRTRGPAAAVHEFPRLPHPPATHLPPYPRLRLAYHAQPDAGYTQLEPTERRETGTAEPAS
jgi:hypothetical protein